MMRSRFSLLPLLLSAWLLLVAPARAEPLVATLTLDGLSYVAFGESDVYTFPSGSLIRVHFGEVEKSGPVSLSIHPRDVVIPPLRLRTGEEEMRFALARPASGSMRWNADGSAKIEFQAQVAVVLRHPEHAGRKQIPIRFTTEAVEATSLDGQTRKAVSGMKVPPAARAVQLVGAATNAADDYPGPGAAVHALLSGVFDRLPEKP